VRNNVELGTIGSVKEISYPKRARGWVGDAVRSGNRSQQRTRRLMRHSEVGRYSTQSLTLRPNRDLNPMLLPDVRSFDHGGVPPHPRSSPQVQESLRIQERDEGQRDDVYLA